jgi:hypothetical protein
MKKQLLFVVAILFLTGCTSSLNTYTLTGTVDDSDGNAVASAPVVAMNRQTNAKYSTTTNATGGYQLDLPNGTYDLGVHRTSDDATYFYGPLTISDNVAEKDISFPDMTGVESTALYGTITHNANTSITGWNVKAISHHQSGSVTDPELGSTTVAADGTFEIDTSDELTMDIDIYDDAGELVEFIDIAKLDGPSYIEMTIGGNTVNIHRHYEDSTNTSTAQETSFLSVAPYKSSHTNDPFEFEGVYNDGRSYWTYHLGGGEIGTHAGHIKINPTYWTMAVTGYSPQGDHVEYVDAAYCFCQTTHVHHESSLEFDIETKDDGSWWYDYKIHVYARGRFKKSSGHYEDGIVSYRFVDRSKPYHSGWSDLDAIVGDNVYSLYVEASDWKWHTVNYNSDDPSIVDVAIFVDKDSSGTCHSCW